MSLDHATIHRIAALARIRVEEHEVEVLCHELNGILGWIEQLNEVDVTGVAPLTGTSGHAGQGTMALGTTAMRPDEITDGGYADRILSNAPDRIGDFFAVPKVVE